MMTRLEPNFVLTSHTGCTITANIHLQYNQNQIIFNAWSLQQRTHAIPYTCIILHFKHKESRNYSVLQSLLQKKRLWRSWRHLHLHVKHKHTKLDNFELTVSPASEAALDSNHQKQQSKNISESAVHALRLYQLINNNQEAGAFF